MVEAIGQYGHGLKPANYHGVRGPYLNEVINDVSELRKKHGQDWQIYGSTFSCQQSRGDLGMPMLVVIYVAKPPNLPLYEV